MGEEVSSRTMRADNYALSEQTKQLRDEEQARLTRPRPSSEARPTCSPSTAARSTGSPTALLEKETLAATRSCEELLGGRCRPSRTPPRRVGMPRAVRRRLSPARGDRQSLRYIARPWRSVAFTTSLSRSSDLDEARGDVPVALRSRGRASRPDRGAGRRGRLPPAGDGRVELVSPLAEDTPVGRFLAKRGPGHAPRRVRGGRRARAARELERDGRRA